MVRGRFERRPLKPKSRRGQGLGGAGREAEQGQGQSLEATKTESWREPANQHMGAASLHRGAAAHPAHRGYAQISTVGEAGGQGTQRQLG